MQYDTHLLRQYKEYDAMVEMNEPENQNPDAEAQAYLAEKQQWMQDAVEIVSGIREMDPFEAFPERTMHEKDATRNDASGLELTPEQEGGLREVAARFGLGAEQNVPSGAEHQVQEGGKPWKVEAQLINSLGGDIKSVVQCGQPGRDLGKDEKDYLEAKYGSTAENEYEMVRQIIEAQDGFVTSEHEEVLPFGYDIHDGNALVHGQTGQLVRIGEVNSVPVLLVRIDNDWDVIIDEATQEEKWVQRNRPDSAAIMGFVAEVLSASGDDHSSIGFNTSNTYASRAIDTVRAGLQAGRSFKVGMYGRDTLRQVGAAAKIPEKAPLRQLLAEFRIINEKLVQLAHEIEA